MTWRLWLDDQVTDINTPNRHPPTGFIGASCTYEALDLVSKQGMPMFIDFDHDLGLNDTAINFLRMLVNLYPDGPVPGYNIHSENPVGKKNIISFMESWKKSLS